MVVFLRIVIICRHSGETSMMNTPHKFLTIAFMAASIFILGLTVDVVSARIRLRARWLPGALWIQH